MEFVSSEAPAAAVLPARRAEVDAVAVDWGSDAILEATLCPPTVGSHPLVLVDPRISGLLALTVFNSAADRCTVGEVCRAGISRDAGVAAAGFAPNVGEIGDG